MKKILVLLLMSQLYMAFAGNLDPDIAQALGIEVDAPPHTILGIRPHPSEDEVKKAKNELSMKWHPDRNKDPRATEVIQVINDAADKIKDPDSYQDDVGSSATSSSDPRAREQLFKKMEVDYLARQITYKEITLRRLKKKAKKNSLLQYCRHYYHYWVAICNRGSSRMLLFN